MVTKSNSLSLSCLVAGAAFVLTGALAAPVQAQTLVQYPFTTAGTVQPITPANDPASYAPSVTNPNVTSTLFLSHLQRAPVQSDIASGVAIEMYPFDGATSDATALAGNTWFGDQLTAASGTTFSISQISFMIGAGGSASPRGYDLRTGDGNSIHSSSSLSENDNLSIGLMQVTINTATLPNPAAYQNISSIFFELFVFTPTPNANSVDMTNFTITGTAAPEPADLALLMAGALPLVAMYRRRQKQK